MKVGLFSAVLNEGFTGVPNYTYNLIKESANLIGNSNYCLINYRETEYFKGVQQITINNPLNVIEKSLPLSSYLWYSLAIRKLNLMSLDLDIIHNPYQVPILGNLRHQKYIITVHDIMQLLYPQYVRKSVFIMQKAFLPQSLSKADMIITDSHNTKKDLINYLQVSPEKIAVIPLAADERYQPIDDRKVESFKVKYGINYPFILHVGSIKPLKNIATLIDAFCKLKKLHPDFKLVIAGKTRHGENAIHQQIEMLNLQKDVIFTGYIPQEDIPALYNAADLFVSPSIYEGFGLPPLEAMACGTPVITSNTSSLPEVVGEAGIMVAPYDIDGLTQAMHNILTNETLKQELSTKGLERARKFSWKRCAEETIKVYEEVQNL